MEGQIFKDITTELDLNGPYLSFTTDPSDVTVSSGTATLSGLATCSYGISNPENIGTVTYQWYEFSSGTTPATYSGTKLTDGTGVSGATTKDLSLSNLVSGTDDQREFYLEAQYTPAQLDYESGNPPNEPLNSTKAGLTIAPTINMISQPTTKVVNTDTQTTFTVDASLSDGSGRALSYQWYVDGTAETNRTKTVTITTSTTVATPHSYAWTSDANHSLPSTAYDITTEIAAAGGGRGGRDAGGDGAPGKTGRAGRFTLESSLAGSTLKYRIGSQGSGGGNCAGQCGGPGGQVTGSGDGTRGGGAGNRGWSGAGGGAGAASYLQGPTGYLIVAGGGGGGGGGSHNRSGIARTPAGTPGDAPGFSAYPGPVPLSSGQPTNDWENSGDGGGGGGGGGGSPGGNTGNRGHDKNHGAYTGYGGGSRYDNPRTNFVRQWGENGNGWANLSYMSTSLQVTTETRRTIISGVNTPTLSLKSDWVGSQSVYCKVSFTGASNTPASSDTVSFTVIPGTTSEMLKIENIDQVGVTASTIETNLLNGAYTIKPLNGGDYIDDIISIYPPDKDIEVYIDLYGASGQDYQYSDGNYSRGGKGGYGRLSMTLKQNQEYVIAGLSTNIGAPMLYEGGNLVAAVGQGGEAGRWGEGGDGGSFNTWQADSASGTGGGDGASLSIGNFSSNGIFGSTMIGAINATTATSYGDSIASGREGGRTIACTKGVYWRQQGKSPCSSLGTVKYRTSNGSQVTSTASITRGYKAGWNIMQTAGAGDKNLATSRGNYYGGDGGNGAFGGQGGTNNRGGGGGTGYISNSATSVSQSAGSNDDQAQVIIRLKT